MFHHFSSLDTRLECLLWLWILMSHRTSLSISLFMSGIIDQLFRRGGANLTFFAITMDIKNLFADLSTVYFNPWVGYMAQNWRPRWWKSKPGWRLTRQPDADEREEKETAWSDENETSCRQLLIPRVIWVSTPISGRECWSIRSIFRLICHTCTSTSITYYNSPLKFILTVKLNTTVPV